MATASTTTGGGDGDRKSASDCAICLEKFKNPKVLPCGHSYCESCLLPFIKFGPHRIRSVNCPHCRKRAVEPSDGFPTNFALKQLLEERIEDEGENNANGGIEVSQSSLEINRTQYERARVKLIATLQKFKSPEIETLRERHQAIGDESKELVMSTNESITKFFKDLSDERTAIEEMLANTFESLTNRWKLFIQLPSFFDDHRFQRMLNSVQKKVSDLEQLSYDMQDPRNRGNGIDSNAAAPSYETAQSAAASSASNEHQETYGTREFTEQFVIDGKYSRVIYGEYGVRKRLIEDFYQCKIEFTYPCDPGTPLITIRGREASRVKAAKTELEFAIEEHIALPPCPVRRRSSNIDGPSTSQSTGFGQSSRTTSDGGGYGAGAGLRMGFEDNVSMANIGRGQSSLDNNK